MEAWLLVEARFDASSAVVMLNFEAHDCTWAKENNRARINVIFYSHGKGFHWRHLKAFKKDLVFMCAMPRGKCGDDSDA